MKSLYAFLTVLALVAETRGGEDAAPGARLVLAARQQIGVTKEYDPGYATLKYPGGDVPFHTGVCSDVVVRALRHVGVDLQKEVHEGPSDGTQPLRSDRNRTSSAGPGR